MRNYVTVKIQTRKFTDECQEILRSYFGDRIHSVQTAQLEIESGVVLATIVMEDRSVESDNFIKGEVQGLFRTLRT